MDSMDKYISGDLFDVIEEAHIRSFIFDVSYFKVSMDVGAVGVAIFQVLEVLLDAGRLRKSADGSDAHWKERNWKLVWFI